MISIKSSPLNIFNKKWLNAGLFLYLFPIALVSGALVVEIICNIIALNFIYKSIKYKLKKYYLNLFVYLFLIFYLYLTGRSLFSVDPLFSIKTSLFYFRFLFFSLGVWYLLDTIPRAKEKFGISIIFTISLVLLGLYVEYFSNNSLFGYKDLIPTRLYSFFGTEPIVGSYLSRLSPFIYFFVLFSNIFNLKKTNHLLIAISFIVLLNLGIFLSGERTSFVFAILIFIIVFFLTKSHFKIKVFISIFSLVLILLTLSYDKNIKTRMIDFTKLQLSKKVEIVDENISGYNNLDNQLFALALKRKESASKIPGFGNYYSSLYYSGYLMFQDNIWFGQGPKMFRKLCGTEKFIVLGGCSTHPHNTYVQLLAEVGIFGIAIPLIIFLFLCVLFANQFLQIIKNIFFKEKLILIEDEMICYLCALFITLFPFSPNGNFFNNWLSFVYFLPVGFILFVYNKKEKNAHNYN